MPWKHASCWHLRYPIAVALATAIVLPIAAALLVLWRVLAEPFAAGTGIFGVLLATLLGLNALLCAWLISRLRWPPSSPIDPARAVAADVAPRFGHADLAEAGGSGIERDRTQTALAADREAMAATAFRLPGEGCEITERKRLQLQAELSRQVLEMAAYGQPLERLLEAITRGVEEELAGGWCNILLLDDNDRFDGGSMEHGEAPGGKEAGQWTEASTDARPGWSTPILSGGKKALGTLTVHFGEEREPREDEREIVEHAVGLAGMVIERYRTEAELLKLSRAVEQSPVSIVITDTHGNIEYVNPRFCASTGYEREEVLGRNPRLLKSGETPTEEYAQLWQAIASGREWKGEMHNRRKDGSLFWEHAHIMPVRTAGGRISHFLAVKEDITERKAAESTLRESERRFRLLVQHAQDGIFIYDHASMRIEYVNPAMLELFGAKNLGELAAVGDTIARVHPDFRETLRRRRELLGREERAPLIEVRFLRLDGTAFEADVQATAVDIGGRRKVQVMVRDISVRKAAEAALRAMSEERDGLLRRLQLEIDHMPIGFVMTDPELRVRDWNPAMERIFGYSREETVGSSVIDLIVRDSERSFAWEHLRLLRETRRTAVLVSLNRKKSGETVFCEWTDTPLFDAGGNFLGLMGMVQDISERKALEDRDRMRQAQLLHSARLVTMGELASTMAHELNQPLTAIANFSGAGLRRLQDSPALHTAREILGMIAAQARRAGEIVWRMRDFVRAEDAQFRPQDLNAVIREIAPMGELQARGPGVTIRFELGADLPPVRADRVQVEQVLLNLVKNGIESMEGEAHGKQLVVRTRRLNQDEVETVVADEGCGLPERMKSDAFPPFFTTKQGGLGLGLSISRSIVEAHGGRLWCAPNAGRGTAFYFTLPVSGREDDASE